MFTPLDDINPYIVFRNALNGMLFFSIPHPGHSCHSTAFQIQNPATYEAATRKLDLVQQRLMMDVLKVAETEANNI